MQDKSDEISKERYKELLNETAAKIRASYRQDKKTYIYRPLEKCRTEIESH